MQFPDIKYVESLININAPVVWHMVVPYPITCAQSREFPVPTSTRAMKFTPKPNYNTQTRSNVEKFKSSLPKLVMVMKRMQTSHYKFNDWVTKVVKLCFIKIVLICQEIITMAMMQCQGRQGDLYKN